MATFIITIDDSVAEEVAAEAREGESKDNTIERMLVTAVGRLAASRKWAKRNAKPKWAKAAKKAAKKAAPKAAKKAAPKAAKKASKPKKAKAPKAETTTPTEQPTLL